MHYSLSVYCPRCGRTEDGKVSTESESIVCGACGHVIARWEEEREDYSWVNVDEPDPNTL